jgi:hypothetical protein
MSDQPPTVLIATTEVSERSGTDLYTRDLALALLRRGWRSVVYTSRAGRVAEELRNAGVPVVTDLSALEVVPDVIHGHHGLETLAAMLRFRAVPALFVCHDGLSWHSIPPRLARIGAYVAVDENCRDRIVLEHGVPATRTRLLFNAVDLRRFAGRPPLPDKPRRALILSNAAREYTFVPAVREACQTRGITLDVAGEGVARATDQPETLLPQYDLVFAKARAALEAMAVGNAVILCDARGLGTLVTSESVEQLRRLNFGMRTLQRSISAESVGAEIDRYDPADAAKVSALIREVAGIDLLALQFADLYDELRATPVASDAAEELDAISAYLQKSAGAISAYLQAWSSSPQVRMGKRVLASRPLSAMLRLLHRFAR